MGVQHIPMYDEGDDYPYIIAPGAFQDGQEAPVTLWVDGKKHRIGTATVRGDKIEVILDDEIDPEVRDVVIGNPSHAHYSIDQSGTVALFGNALDAEPIIKKFPQQLEPLSPELQKLKESFLKHYLINPIKVVNDDTSGTGGAEEAE